MTQPSTFRPAKREEFPDRSLPSSEEAERAVLAAILLDINLIFGCIGVLHPDDFYVAFHRRVYAAMLTIFERGGKIDPIMIGEELKRDGTLEAFGGVAAITNLTVGLPYFTDIDDYIKTVKTKSRERNLVRICAETANTALNQEDEFDAVLDQHEQMISDLRNKDTINHFVPIGQSVNETVRQISDFAKSGGKELLGLSTGFKDLDVATSGMEKADLIIVAARPSMGKTALALQMAQRAAGAHEDIVIAVFSLEMSRKQLTQRMLSSTASVDMGRLRRGMLTNQEWTRVTIAQDTLAGLNIVIDDTPALSTMQIKAKVRRLLTERKRLDMVLIDHGGHIKHASDHRRSEHLRISETMKELKAQAKEFDVPYVVLWQLSRKVEERKPPKPIMSDLRESGSIEEDADKIWFIYRPEYYLKDNCPDIDRGIAELIIGKNRNGPTDTPIKLAFLKHYVRFEDYHDPMRNY